MTTDVFPVIASLPQVTGRNHWFRQHKPRFHRSGEPAHDSSRGRQNANLLQSHCCLRQTQGLTPGCSGAEEAPTCYSEDLIRSPRPEKSRFAFRSVLIATL